MLDSGVVPRPRGHAIQALQRADAVLDALLDGPGPLRLAELAAATGLNKTTVYNLVETLVTLGFVARDDADKTYRLGLRNLQLGRALERQLDVAAAARPSLMTLCHETGETANLALPFAFEAMIVDSFEGERTVRVTSYAGTRASYHSTACGKAILAHLDAPVRKAIYAARPLTLRTARTITDTDRLERNLATVRREGLALDIEENEPGAHCVAVPIFDTAHRVVGSISLAGPTARMSRARLSALAGEIDRHTKEISARLYSDGSLVGRRATRERRARA